MILPTIATASFPFEPSISFGVHASVAGMHLRSNQMRNLRRCRRTTTQHDLHYPSSIRSCILFLCIIFIVHNRRYARSHLVYFRYLSQQRKFGRTGLCRQSPCPTACHRHAADGVQPLVDANSSADCGLHLRTYRSSSQAFRHKCLMVYFLSTPSSRGEIYGPDSLF